ncbi:tetratricopeptide repeat protein, partial [bacterium]|nr:tetratricopeptide repeat protein [candidate division CSSED10-310 bacterium]
NALLPIALILVWLIFSAIRARRGTVLLGFSVPWLLALGTLAMRNHAAGDEWMILQARGGFNFYYYNGPAQADFARLEPGRSFEQLVREPETAGISGTSAQSAYFLRKSLQCIIQEPRAYLAILARRAGWLLAGDELSVSTPVHDWKQRTRLLKACCLLFGFGTIAMLALTGLACRPERTTAAPLLLVVTGYTASNLLVATGMRYRAPLTAVLIPFAAVGATLMISMIRAGAKGGVGRRITTAVLYIAGVAATLYIPVPHPFHTAFYEGIAFERLTMFEAAAANLVIAVAERPDSAVAWKALGNVRQAQGDFQAATDALRRAIAIEPEDPALYNNLGLALARMERDKDAEAAFTSAIEIEPEYTPAHVNLGNLYRGRGEFETAVKTYERLLEFDPGHVQARIELATCRWLSGDPETAEKINRELSEEHPEDPYVQYNFGLVLLGLERWREAITPLEKSVALQPGMLPAWYNLGVARYRVGLEDEAARAWEECVRLDPGFEPGVKNLARLLAVKGKNDEAKRLFELYRETIRRRREPTR